MAHTPRHTTPNRATAGASGCGQVGAYKGS
jgi:hypothetical protein